jgi:hypothetical protein
VVASVFFPIKITKQAELLPTSEEAFKMAEVSNEFQ